MRDLRFLFCSVFLSVEVIMKKCLMSEGKVDTTEIQGNIIQLLIHQIVTNNKNNNLKQKNNTSKCE